MSPVEAPYSQGKPPSEAFQPPAGCESMKMMSNTQRQTRKHAEKGRQLRALGTCCQLKRNAPDFHPPGGIVELPLGKILVSGRPIDEKTKARADC
jgi:hypothetical protein